MTQSDLFAPDGQPTPEASLCDIKAEAARARAYLKITGLNVPPDTVKDALNLSTSSATLGRKFRASCSGDNPELLRSYYVNGKGRTTAQYRYNPYYKGTL
jgi:hypothetical protein